MKIWKKNLVAAALLLTVCVGIYANWTYGEAQQTMNFEDTLDSQKVMSEELMVLSEDQESAQTTATDYFAAVRLSRQEARDSAVALLQEAMAYSEQGDAEASNSELEGIVQTALCEAQIESIVIAKGYTDCVAYIASDGISVAVAAPEGGLKQEDVAVIADIVMNQSEFGLDKIRVVEVL